jgi:hypothetical protein
MLLGNAPADQGTQQPAAGCTGYDIILINHHLEASSPPPFCLSMSLSQVFYGERAIMSHADGNSYLINRGVFEQVAEGSCL